MNYRVIVVCFVLWSVVAAANDGAALKPPMGYRDWNQFQCNIDQDMMLKLMDGMVDRNRLVDGRLASLADLGYTDIGLDDCWQKCQYNGNGTHGSYHDHNGNPVVDTDRFPDLKAMTDYGHERALTVGWYHNNCKCKDACSDVKCFAGDVDATIRFGFDSVKLDSCSMEKNVALWYAMFNHTLNPAHGGSGKPMVIENCHNGPLLPTEGWCPFHYYRSSPDINTSYGAVLSNLNTIPALAAQNLSYPGCWAYPDMLEVGVDNSNNKGEQFPALTYHESRSHFGAWCIVSAPLILGMDLTNATVMDGVWDIITNTEAIAINQDYAGFSGSVFWRSQGESYFLNCTSHRDCRIPSLQYWFKPLSNGDVAVLLMNNGEEEADLQLSWPAVPGLQAAAGVFVRDVWQRRDVGPVGPAETYSARVQSHDSVFLRLSPLSGSRPGKLWI